MKRKAVSMLLAATLTIVLLAACGSQAASDNAATESTTEEVVADEATVADEAAASEIPTPTWEELSGTFALSIDTEGLSADELYALGQQYENGDEAAGIVQWYAKAYAYYTAAKEAGSADAESGLARLDDLKAEWQQVSANAEDDQADPIFQFFRTGVTESQNAEANYEKIYAIYYDDTFFFEDAASRGLLAMGDLLIEGKGVEQDIAKGVSVYKYCADVLGKGNAYTSLGLIYDTTQGEVEGFAKSDETALNYYLLSCQEKRDGYEPDFKGPRRAADIYDRGYVMDDGTEVAPDYVTAEKYYLLATTISERSADVTAYYKLATYYEEGREGVEQDYAKAVDCYLKVVNDKSVHATQLGVPQTYLSLARFYESGNGVEQDLEQAKAYYQQAKDAAEENMVNEELAGYDAAKAVFDEASEALDRLS